METSIFEMMQEKQLVTKRGIVFYWYSKCSDADTTLVFLHGLTADHTLFEKQLSHYRSRVNLLCWDAPAHGKSRPYKEFSYDAAKVLKEILDQEYIIFISYDAITPVTAWNLNLIAQIHFVVLQQLYR